MAVAIGLNDLLLGLALDLVRLTSCARTCWLGRGVAARGDRDQAVVAARAPAADRHRVAARRAPRLRSHPAYRSASSRPASAAQRSISATVGQPACRLDPQTSRPPASRCRAHAAQRRPDRLARRTAARCRRGRRRRTCARGRAWPGRRAPTRRPGPAAAPARACRGRRRRRRPRCLGGPARCRPARCRSRRRGRSPDRGPHEVGLTVHRLAGRRHALPPGVVVVEVDPPRHCRHSADVMGQCADLLRDAHAPRVEHELAHLVTSIAASRTTTPDSAGRTAPGAGTCPARRRRAPRARPSGSRSP